MLHRGGFAERASSESLQNTSTLTIPDTTSHSLSGFSLPKCPAALPTKLQSHVPWTHLALPNAPMLVWIGRGPGHVNPQPIGLYWSWFWGGGHPRTASFLPHWLAAACWHEDSPHPSQPKAMWAPLPLSTDSLSASLFSRLQLHCGRIYTL